MATKAKTEKKYYSGDKYILLLAATRLCQKNGPSKWDIQEMARPNNNNKITGSCSLGDSDYPTRNRGFTLYEPEDGVVILTESKCDSMFRRLQRSYEIIGLESDKPIIKDNSYEEKYINPGKNDIVLKVYGEWLD